MYYAPGSQVCLYSWQQDRNHESNLFLITVITASLCKCHCWGIVECPHLLGLEAIVFVASVICVFGPWIRSLVWRNYPQHRSGVPSFQQESSAFGETTGSFRDYYHFSLLETSKLMSKLQLLQLEGVFIVQYKQGLHRHCMWWSTITRIWHQNQFLKFAWQVAADGRWALLGVNICWIRSHLFGVNNSALLITHIILEVLRGMGKNYDTCFVCQPIL